MKIRWETEEKDIMRFSDGAFNLIGKFKEKHKTSFTKKQSWLPFFFGMCFLFVCCFLAGGGEDI